MRQRTPTHFHGPSSASGQRARARAYPVDYQLRLCEDGVREARLKGDDLLRAHYLCERSALNYSLGHFVSATVYGEEALGLVDHQDAGGILLLRLLVLLSCVNSALQAKDVAEQLRERAIGAASKCRDLAARSIAYRTLAQGFCSEQNYEAARQFASQAVRMAEGDRDNAQRTLLHLVCARVAVGRRDWKQAKTEIRAAWRHQCLEPTLRLRSETELCFAEVAARTGQLKEARRRAAGLDERLACTGAHAQAARAATLSLKCALGFGDTEGAEAALAAQATHLENAEMQRANEERRLLDHMQHQRTQLQRARAATERELRRELEAVVASFPSLNC